MSRFYIKSIHIETVRKVCENFQYLNMGIFVYVLSGRLDIILTIKQKNILNKIIIFIFIILILSLSSFEVKAEIKHNPIKKVSLEEIIYLEEDYYHLKKYLYDSKVYDIVEKCMNEILHSNKKIYTINCNKKTTENQLETVIAIIESKYYQYYDLEYYYEYDGSLKININKSRINYFKNIKIKEKIDNILFNQLNINNNTTEYEAVFKINDWLYNNVEYDNNFKSYTINDIILKGKGICCSYSDTFKLMCNRIGIEAYCVSSDKMNHQWNTVIIDGKEYHIDTCWNDCGYYDKWFLLSEKEMLKDHLKPDWKDTKRVKIPKYYTIYYELNGGLNNEKNVEHIIEGYNQILYNPSKKGYEFVGWYTDSNYKNKINSINSKIANNYKLYAKWKKIKKPIIKNIKVKKNKNYIKINWTSNNNDKIQYKINIKTFENKKNNIILTKNQIKMKNNSKYIVYIKPYIKDSTGKNIYGKQSIIKINN